MKKKDCAICYTADRLWWGSRIEAGANKPVNSNNNDEDNKPVNTRTTTTTKTVNQLTATTTTKTVNQLTATTITTKTVNQLTATTKTVNQLTATTITKTINAHRCLLTKHIHPNNSGTNDTVGGSGVILFYWCINSAYFISSILVSLSIYFWQLIIFTSLFLVGHYHYQFISGSSLSLSVYFW